MKSNFEFMADLMLQKHLLTLSEKGLAISLVERDIKYNGEPVTVSQFKNIIKDNLQASYVQTLSELFTGNVE